MGYEEIKMDFKVSEILRQISSDFVILAEEVDKWQETTNRRLDYIESETETNRSALKEAANVILSKLN